MFRPRKRKPSEKKQRSPEFYARQATRTVRSRTFWLMLVMGAHRSPHTGRNRTADGRHG